MTAILTVPGLFNSGPDHWQSHWERQLPNIRRIHQQDYENAVCAEWVKTIDATVRQYGENVVLVGHSCGSIAIPHWAANHSRSIKGAVLVGPSDVELPDFPKNAVGFKPIPLEKLPFPSIVIASSEDPYIALTRAEYFAKCWGSRLIDLGPAGHINAASGHGPWPEGLQILERFIAAQN